MKKIILPLIITLLSYVWVQAQCSIELLLEAPATEVVEGETICLDVKVNNFEEVSGFFIVMEIDSTLFTIDDVTGPENVNFDIDPGDYSHRDNRFRFLIFEGNAGIFPVIPNGEVLFNVCLRAISDKVGESSSVQIIESESDFSLSSGSCFPTIIGSNNAPITITSALETDYSVVNASCQVANGAFSIEITGGTAPYQVSWAGISNGVTGTNSYTAAGGMQSMANDLETGRYAVSIESGDLPPYTRIDTISISNSDNFSLTFDEERPCESLNNGSLRARLSLDGTEVDLANPRYTVTWNTGATGALLENLSAGTYTVTIDDSVAECELSETINLRSASIFFNPNISQVSCQDDSELGSILVNPSNGSAPYEVTWAHSGANSFLIDNLIPGSYSVQVEDDNGCVVDTIINIVRPVPPTIRDVVVSQPTCNDPGNGTIEVVLEGGTGEPGDFIWTYLNTNTVLSENATRLSGVRAGNYSWQVVTTDNCILQGMEEISAVNLMEIDDIIVKNESCPAGQGNLAADGGLQVLVSGGTAPYTYTWSDIPNAASTNNTREDLTAGTYQITVIDDTGCRLTSDSVRVLKPDPIDIQFSDMQPATCPQSSVDGQVTALVTGGTPGDQGYWFEWNSGETGIGNSHRAIGLPAGVNNVIVTDVNFCQHEAEVTIGSPNDLLAVLDENILTETSCAETSDGRIRIFPQGGTAPYSVVWDHGSTGTDITGLPAGNYRYTLEDANGCKYSSSVQITSPESLDIQYEAVSSSDVTCQGENDGSIEVTPIGGTPPYTYQWSTGVPAGVEATARPLAPGTYALTLTDKNNCRATLSDMVVRDKEPIRFDIPTPEPITCAGGVTLLSVQNIQGGNGNAFELIINDVIAIDAIEGVAPLTAGRYTVRVQDEVFGCYSDTIVSITEPRPVQVGLGQDREIIIGDTINLVPEIANTVDSVTYLWQSSRGDEFCMDCPSIRISPQRKTTYSLRVVDGNGCEGVDEVTIDVDRNRRVNFPNIFAPNGSGRNMTFGPIIDLSSNAIRNFGYFRVFDRWGNIVHEAMDIEPSTISSYYWDGSLNGRLLPSGIYIYTAEVTFADNQTFVYRGHVTMLR